MSTFPNMDSALPVMAFRTLTDGSEVGSRLGEKTFELLHQQIILERPWQREILVPTRNVNIAAQIAETMWVLAGRADVEFLSHYLPRAADFSDDDLVWRGGYGPRLRRWSLTGDAAHGTAAKNYSLDQIKHIVDLLSEDRSSRRAVVSIYDPRVDAAPGKDIPCNDFLSFISREGSLDLSVFVRSNDLVWGWSGINAFEWSALQEIVAGLLGLRVGRLVFNTTSLHIYDRHWKKAQQIQEHAGCAPVGSQDSPRFSMRQFLLTSEHPIDALDELISRWFDIEARLRKQGFLEGEADQIIDGFPEPMFQSWLRVLAWYWSGDQRHLKPLEGTRLWAATQELPNSISQQVTARNIATGLAYGIAQGDPGLEGRVKEPDTWVVAGRPSGPDGEYQAGDKVQIYPGHTVPADTTGVIKPLAYKMAFVPFVDALHREKSAAYGDSWKKRGELFSIIPNIARKIDRLEGGKSTEDEVIADTAIDLLVYLVKYRLWLGEDRKMFRVSWAAEIGDETDRVLQGLENLHTKTTMHVREDLIPSYVTSLVNYFERLQQEVSGDPHLDDPRDRVLYVDQMITWSFILARHLWEQEQGEATGSYVSQ